MSDKYTFRRECTDRYGQKRIVEHTVEAESLPEVLEEFLYFLNGCSFFYVKDLIWVRDSGQEEAILDYQADLYQEGTLKNVDDLEEELNEIENKLK